MILDYEGKSPLRIAAGILEIFDKRLVKFDFFGNFEA